jgi:hypothetical protein
LWIVGKVVRLVKGAEDQEAGYEKALDDRFFASLCVAAGKNASCCDSCTYHCGEQHTRDLARVVFVRDPKKYNWKQDNFEQDKRCRKEDRDHCEEIGSSEPVPVVRKLREQMYKSASSMAKGKSGAGVEFGHGFVLLGEIEERVVAEAVGAAWCGQDLAFDGAVADGEDVAVAGGGEDAVVAGAALGEGYAGEEGEEVEVIAMVG